MCFSPPLSDQEERKREKKERRKTIKFVVEVISAVVLAGYFGVTILILRTNRHANEIAQQAIEAQTRPWLSAMDNPKITQTHEFPTNIAFDINVRNFGSSVGLFMPPKFVFSETNKPSVNVPLADRMCQEIPRGINRPELVENAVFPGEAGTRTKNVIAWNEDSKYQRRPQFAVGCIAYIGTGVTVYYTEVAYLLSFASDDPGQRTKYLSPTGISLAWIGQYPH